MICPKCGQRYPDQYTTCPYCGDSDSTVFSDPITSGKTGNYKPEYHIVAHSQGSGWITIMKFCAWVEFCCITIGGIVACIYFSGRDDTMVYGVLSVIGSIILAVIVLASNMLKITMAENIAGIVDNTRATIDFLTRNDD